MRARSANDTSPCLVVGPSWVGDMVMAQSMFMLLRERAPDAEIHVLAPSWTLPLLERMPEISHAIDMPLGHGELGLLKRYRLGKKLGRYGYGRAIVLPNSFKSALVPCWANIPRRTGFRGELRGCLLNDMRLLDKARLPGTVHRFAALALDAGEPLPSGLPRPALVVAEDARLQTTMRSGPVDDTKPVAVLCPGAEYGPAKRWPVRHFAALCDQLDEAGWQIWLLGSVADCEMAAGILDGTQAPVRDLTGKTSLGEAIDLMSCASAVVSNDSGLMHIAAALDRPLVALYGSSDPLFTPPLSSHAKILSLNLECSPCFKRSCPLGHFDCMNQMEPAQVFEAIQSLTVAGRPS